MKPTQLLLLTGLVVLTACSADTEPEPVCSTENTFQFNSADYCVVIEEGFLSLDCPDEFPNGREFEQFTICTAADEVTDEIEQRALEAGFGTPPDPVCEEGSTRPADDGCNTCTCDENAWSCTEMACDTLSMCLAACGDGCPEPDFQLCGVDGQDYCNTCAAACYDVELAPNREPCDCPAPVGELVPNSDFQVAPGCALKPEFAFESGVAFTVAEAAAWFDCESFDQIPFEEGSEVLVRAVFPQQPEATLGAVVYDAETGIVTLPFTAPQYCGGPAPSATILLQRVRLVPDAEYVVSTCVHTRCTEFFP